MFMKLLYTLSLMTPIMIVTSNHPLAMGMLIITSIILLSLISILTMKSSWFLYIIMLIFVGGMLILFIYMTSMAPNEKFQLNMSVTMPLLVIMISLLTVTDPSLLTETFTSQTSPYSSNKIFNSSSKYMSMFLINYLFIMMIFVTKMIKKNEGPMRKLMN